MTYLSLFLNTKNKILKWKKVESHFKRRTGRNKFKNKLNKFALLNPNNKLEISEH